MRTLIDWRDPRVPRAVRNGRATKPWYWPTGGETTRQRLTTGYKVPSTSKLNVVYGVSIEMKREGDYPIYASCNCEAGQHGIPCKHVGWILAHGGWFKERTRLMGHDPLEDAGERQGVEGSEDALRFIRGGDTDRG